MTLGARIQVLRKKRELGVRELGVGVNYRIGTWEEDDLPRQARVRDLPSSISASLLVSADAKQLTIIVRWGAYKVRQGGEGEAAPFVWDQLRRRRTPLMPRPNSGRL